MNDTILENQLEEARKLIKEQQYGLAMVTLQKLIAQMEKNSDMVSPTQTQQLVKRILLPAEKNISLCLFKQQMYQECLSHCRWVLQLDSRCSKTLYRAGVSLTKLKQPEEARSMLERGFMLCPGEQAFQRALQALSQPQLASERSVLKGLVLFLVSIVVVLWRELLGLTTNLLSRTPILNRIPIFRPESKDKHKET